MTEFLQAIKTDLLSRRLLPAVVVLGVALIAAVAYAVAAGSASSTPSVSAGVAAAGGTGASRTSGSVSVSVAAANPQEAVSETPGGTRYQSKGPTRDPFVPLPTPATSSGSSKSANSSTGSSSGGSSSGGSSSTGKSGGGSSSPAPAPVPAKPSAPSKPKNPYTVSVLFGVPSSTPGQPATLTPYPSLSLGQSLPSKQDSRIVFERVTSTGKGAIFKLVVPPILHGTGTCLPSQSECETIDLEAGHYEVLEYVEASGQNVTYEVGVVSIVKNSGSASAARAKRAIGAAQRKRLARIMRAADSTPAAGA